jgi:AhpD family alkylhydroperoxidase
MSDEPTAHPRLSEPETLDEHQRVLLASMRTGPEGRPLNLFGILVHHPLLLDRVASLGRVFLREGTLVPRERELVILRVARSVQCRYEFAQHVRLGLDAGVTEVDVERIVRPGLDGWTAREAALLRFADDLLESDDVDETTWNAVAALLDTMQMLELVFLVGYYRMLAGFLRSASVPLEASVPLPAQARSWD